MLSKRRTAAALTAAALAVTTPLTALSSPAAAHHRDGDRWERRGHHHGGWTYRTDGRTTYHRRWHDWATDRGRNTTTGHDGAQKLRVHSTAYCLEGRMANGQRAHDGAAAMNGVPLGTRFRIMTGPLRGEVVTVKDRIGSGSEFDVAMPDDCSQAYRYGRRTVNIKRVTST